MLTLRSILGIVKRVGWVLLWVCVCLFVGVCVFVGRVCVIVCFAGDTYDG